MGESDERDFSVLVVEDDPNHQLLIRNALLTTPSSFSVVQIARDSNEAERFTKQMSFDCLVVDNRIPGRRGLDLINLLRERGVEAPAILMTSVGNEDLVVAAYRHKVAEYVIKEAGFWRELPVLIERVIQANRGRQRELALRDRLERTNARLDTLNTEMQQANVALNTTRKDLDKARRDAVEHAAAITQALTKPIEALEELREKAGNDKTTGVLTQVISQLRACSTRLSRLREQLAAPMQESSQNSDPRDAG